MDEIERRRVETEARAGLAGRPELEWQHQNTLLRYLGALLRGSRRPPAPDGCPGPDSGAADGPADRA